MKQIILFCLLFICLQTKAQTDELELPTINIRLSCLVFPPFSPLLTLETSAFSNLTIQAETNFVNTHGINLKYFLNERMREHYVFLGNAFIANNFLRKDNKITFLPYAGYGYAYRFGRTKAWIFDSRIGIGQTTNADNNSILPVIKTGVGLTF
jgi:hypothetical protein